MIDKTTYLKLREAAQATCGNAFLLDDGSILTRAQYRKLSLVERLRVVAYFQYATNQIIKI